VEPISVSIHQVSYDSQLFQTISSKAAAKVKIYFIYTIPLLKKNTLLWNFEFRGCMKGLGDWKTEDDETGRLVIFIPN
jgi:hypothetical protein